MTHHQPPSSSLLVLLICLCLVILAILPFLQGVVFFTEMVASGAEPGDHFEQAELEDDLLMGMGDKDTAASKTRSKCGLAQLCLPSGFFLPQTPPPKFS